MAENWGFAPDGGSAFFISYNSPDSRRIAPIAKALKEMGYPVWYDRGIEVGTQRWKAQISAAIDRSHAVIIFVTRGIFDRERCYVLNEHDEAASIKKPVIPVFLDRIDPAAVPVEYRAYVTEWNSMQGVPYRSESPTDTARRIAEAIEQSSRIKFKLPRRTVAYTPPPRPTVNTQRYVERPVYVPAQPVYAPSPAVGNTYAQVKSEPKGKSAKKTTIIIIAAALVAAIVLGVVFWPGGQTATSSGIGDVSVGDHVYLGSYPQTEDGEVQPIEWRVLDVRDGKALLISEYPLDCKKYNETNTSVTWETCSMRRWLNEDFYNTAFSAEEQANIVQVHNDNPNNPTYYTGGGSDTDDYVFCLSIEEAEKYFKNNEDRKASPTKYAKKHGAFIDDTYGTGWWWLRSPGNYSDYAAYGDTDGSIYINGNYVNYFNGCVRPVVLASL